MSIDQKIELVASFLETASINELRHFHKVLASRFGFDIAQAGQIVEPDKKFRVVLKSYEIGKKIGVIGIVRKLTNLGLWESKNLVEQESAIILSGISHEDAVLAKVALAKVGGSVDLEEIV